MNNTELRKLHNALLYSMDEIDRICELNHINYTLTDQYTILNILKKLNSLFIILSNKSSFDI